MELPLLHRLQVVEFVRIPGKLEKSWGRIVKLS